MIVLDIDINYDNKYAYELKSDSILEDIRDSIYMHSEVWECTLYETYKLQFEADTEFNFKLVEDLRDILSEYKVDFKVYNVLFDSTRNR